MEPKVGNGTEWLKFLNNDGQEVSQRSAHGQEVEEFRLKAFGFAHWTFKRFSGKAIICDLQGNEQNIFILASIFG